MAFRRLPLLDENDREHAGHCKVDARRVERQHTADERADDRADDPVGVVENGDQKAHRVRVDVRGRFQRAEQRVGLIGQREDHVPLARAHAVECLEKGQTVENVTAVEQQRHHRDRHERRLRREQRDEQVLSRAGVDGQTAQKRPRGGEADVAQHDAERETDEQIAAEHGNSRRECGT